MNQLARQLPPTMNQLRQQIDLRGSIEEHTGTPWDLVSTTDPLVAWEEENGRLPSHFRDYKKVSIEDSNFGTLAWQGAVLMDICHEYEVESWHELRFDIFEANTRFDRLKGDTDELRAYVDERREAIYHNMVDNFSFKNQLLGGAPVPDDVFHDTENELWELATRMAYSKFAFGTFRAYLTECRVIDTLEEMGVGPVLAVSADIEKHVDIGEYDTAESAGIDLYLPEEGTAIQVKEGRGGKTDDESDVLARFIHEDTAKPYVHFTDNRE